MRRGAMLARQHGAVTAAPRLAAPECFADDAAGFDYFATDTHYQHLAAAIRRSMAAARGFVLVTGEPGPDGGLLARHLGGNGGECRISLVRCRPGMGFDELMQDFGRQLRLREEGQGGVWPVLSQLMQDSRKGIANILVLHDAGLLEDRSFDELHRFARLDEPHVLPVVLLASPSFVERLDTPALQFLKPAIAAQLRLHWLAPEEGTAFIHYQLRVAGCDEHAVAPETIASLAEAAQGDPLVLDRMVRHAAGLVVPGPAPMTPRAAHRSHEGSDDARGEEKAMAAAHDEPVRPAESIAAAGPRDAPPGSRHRYLRRGLAWAGCLTLAAGCAAALFYIFAPGEARMLAADLQAAAGSPELAAPDRAAALTDLPVPPDPPTADDERARSVSEATAREVAAVEPSAAPPASPAPEPPAQVPPAVAPEAPPALASIEADPAPAAPHQVQRPPAEDIALLVKRGEALLASGDIASARRFFERAAEGGDAAAAIGLGSSYDPLFLGKIRSRGVTGDPAKAAEWYRRAAASGSVEAAALLARLLSQYPH